MEAEPDVVSSGFGVVVIVTSLVQASAIKQFIKFKRLHTIIIVFCYLNNRGKELFIFLVIEF